MKIAIFGSSGQLGQSLQKECCKNGSPYEFFFYDKSQVDITSAYDVDEIILANKFDFVINCAAYTNVEGSEENSFLANEINNKAPINISNALLKSGGFLIHISTDYVFNGKFDGLYSEDQNPHPINFYGLSKLKGERNIQKIMKKNALIIRSSWLYSEFSSNFLKTILHLSKKNNEINVVNDQFGTPTYAGNLANLILHLIKKEHFEKDLSNKTMLLHYSDEKKMSWYEFALEIKEKFSLDTEIIPIDSSSYKFSAIRPVNSALRTSLYLKNITKDLTTLNGILECVAHLDT